MEIETLSSRVTDPPEWLAQNPLLHLEAPFCLTWHLARPFHSETSIWQALDQGDCTPSGYGGGSTSTTSVGNPRWTHKFVIIIYVFILVREMINLFFFLSSPHFSKSLFNFWAYVISHMDPTYSIVILKNEKMKEG
jgi:hypothetical protein